MTYRDRAGAQRWIVTLLYRGVEGVHVDVDDLANESGRHARRVHHSERK
jgi:hypothetical protein